MAYTERAEMSAVSCGTSHASAVSTPLQWIVKNALYKAIHLCRITCERSESARERRIVLYKSYQQSTTTNPRLFRGSHPEQESAWENKLVIYTLTKGPKVVLFLAFLLLSMLAAALFFSPPIILLTWPGVVDRPLYIIQSITFTPNRNVSSKDLLECINICVEDRMTST